MSRRLSLARSHDNACYRRRRASRSKRVAASDHQGTRTEVALACRETPNLALIEAEYTRRSKAMEEKIESLEKKVSTHDNFLKSQIQAAAQGSGNPNFFIGGAMGMVQEEQFDQDNLLSPFKSYFLSALSSDTVSFFLPFALLDANTLRPFAEAILLRNPCLLLLFLLDG